MSNSSWISSSKRSWKRFLSSRCANGSALPIFSRSRRALSGRSCRSSTNSSKFRRTPRIVIWPSPIATFNGANAFTGSIMVMYDAAATILRLRHQRRLIQRRLALNSRFQLVEGPERDQGGRHVGITQHSQAAFLRLVAEQQKDPRCQKNATARNACDQEQPGECQSHEIAAACNGYRNQRQKDQRHISLPRWQKIEFLGDMQWRKMGAVVEVKGNRDHSCHQQRIQHNQSGAK